MVMILRARKNLFTSVVFFKFRYLIAFDAVARKCNTNTSAWYYNSKRAGAGQILSFKLLCFR